MHIKLDVISRRRKEPLHKQLSSVIRGAIQHGIYLPGQQIETEVEFMKQGNLSNRTVARAFKELVDDGLVKRCRGVGSFVADPLPRTLSNKTIGVVYKDIEDEIFIRILKGIQDVTANYGHTTYPISIGMQTRGESQVLDKLTQHKVDGILVIPDMGAGHHRELVHLISSQVPIVLLESYLPEVACDAVIINNQHLGFELTKHLCDLGHRRIRCLCMNLVYPFLSIQDRLAGIKLALARANIDSDDWLTTLPQVYSINDVKDALIDMLKLPKNSRPTAIICIHDRLALNVYNILHELNVKIPNDISIVSFDDMSFAADLNPPLTTAHQPRERLGREGISLFYNRCTFPDRQAVRVVIDANIVIRQSTGLPSNKSIILK